MSEPTEAAAIIQGLRSDLAELADDMISLRMELQDKGSRAITPPSSSADGLRKVAELLERQHNVVVDWCAENVTPESYHIGRLQGVVIGAVAIMRLKADVIEELEQELADIDPRPSAPPPALPADLALAAHHYGHDEDESGRCVYCAAPVESWGASSEVTALCPWRLLGQLQELQDPRLSGESPVPPAPAKGKVLTLAPAPARDDANNEPAPIECGEE